MPPSPDHPDESRYEIFHDVLGPAVTDWRLRHEHRREQEAAERAVEAERQAAQRRIHAARRRTVRWGALALVMGVLLVVVSFLAYRFVQGRDEARSRELAAEASALAVVRPDKAVDRSLAALRESSTTEAEAALRRGLSSLNLAGSLGKGEKWLRIGSNADGSVLATESDTDQLQLWRLSPEDDENCPGPVRQPDDRVEKLSFVLDPRRRPPRLIRSPSSTASSTRPRAIPYKHGPPTPVSH